MAVGDASAIAYRIGTDAASEGHWAEAHAAFRHASTLDPWNPAGPKALAVAADRLGLTADARAAAEEAVRLSPGDGPSWINLALLCREQGDRACARHAADRAVDAATPRGPRAGERGDRLRVAGRYPCRRSRLPPVHADQLPDRPDQAVAPPDHDRRRAGERAGGGHGGAEPADRPTADRRADPGRRLRRGDGARAGGGHDRRPGHRRGGGAARPAPRPVVHPHVGGGRPAGTALRHRRWAAGARRRRHPRTVGVGSVAAAVADLRHRHLPRLSRRRAGQQRGAAGSRPAMAVADRAAAGAADG